MKYEVEIQYRFNHHVKHVSHILMGLLLLAEKNIIQLTWKRVSVGQITQAGIMVIVRESSTDKVKSIYFEMHDLSNRFETEFLESCDIYFKRSFFRKDIAALKSEYQSKIRLYGINLPVTNTALTYKVLSQSALQIMRHFPVVPNNIYRLTKYCMNSYHQFIGLPSIEEYTQLPDSDVSRTVFFQSRVWPQEYVGNDNAEMLNEQRIALVRALRKNFKEQFVGGILPTDYAKKYFSDCITTQATDSKGYIRLLKSNLVGVYTRGLNHSIALKMPEYIAASLCIVTDNIRNETAGSFTKDVNYLEFGDVDTCVSHCEKLLMDKEFAQNMRQQNYNYYLANIEPSNKALQCLDEAFSL